MGYKLSRYLSKSIGTSLLMYVFVCLVFTHSLILAHDPTHHGHEETDICNVLTLFSGNTDCIVADSTSLLLLFEQIQIPNRSLYTVDSSVILYHRSRAPPLYQI